MIPLKYVLKHMEKNAGVASTLIDFAKKYPKITVGAGLGAAIVGGSTVGSLIANNIRDIATIANERGKRKVMLGQQEYLRQIADSVRPEAEQPIDPRRIPIVEPLTMIY